MCPSPETRSPTRKPRTSWPISTISPTYSWPTCIGTGIVFCAQSSHFQMWMSVPQIAVLRMRIMTSLCPTSGVLTSVSVSPGARVSFASAFIMSVASFPIHRIASSALPTFANAATAASISASVCSALICVRMRALPFGTTGYENPIT